ncbi:MAG TPA: hypothetical protein VFH78_15340 [Candidatus Thermoplasmatota archaeon]|nr:hypothetical protein [Candidatus Thermoplasmatota archaeon]
MGRRKSTVKGARSLVGTLLVAWTFITGSAIVIASASYYQTHDLRILIVWLAPPFVIGCALFLLMGIVSVAGNVREREVPVTMHRGTRQSIFRER